SWIELNELLEFVHDFRFVYSSRLHDCVFLKNLSCFNFRIRYIPMSIALLFIFFCFPPFPLGLQR
ncbi:hypothetical protein, partial [Sphingobacterium ginsenosidimutans]|uniref:hypothetical protein n=1 Tax=Sphingobacterium ginsenosidimutans TaxID=687845 RepID=UPI0031F7DD59